MEQRRLILLYGLMLEHLYNRKLLNKEHNDFLNHEAELEVCLLWCKKLAKRWRAKNENKD